MKVIVALFGEPALAEAALEKLGEAGAYVETIRGVGYRFRSSPGDDVRVLLRLDEDSYRGGEMGGDHPIAWCHEYDGGRTWYTGGGHTRGSFAEPLFRQHVLGGIRWAIGMDDEEGRTEAAAGRE